MASPNTTPRIVELAAQISTSVAELQERLSAQGVPSPSFAEDNPEFLPANVAHLQDAVLDATAELNELLMDPLTLIFKFGAISNLVSIDTICRFHIADMIPAGGQVSFGEIAEKTGLDKLLVRRLLRHAMAMRILREPEPGMVAHTKVSQFLTIPYINAWVNFENKDTWPACTRIVDAIQKWPSSEEPNQTGFCLANNTDKSVYEVLGTDPTRAMRFASLIGQAAIELANHFGNVKLLVQDAAMMIAGAETDVPEQLKGHVEFMKHELFDPQTVQADIYFFRMVFRNWGDKYALQILKAQIPALRPGAKILIQDVCMPEPDTIPLWRERIQRSVDLSLKCYFNGRERYLDEWKALLAAADKRFVLHRVFEPKGSLLGILEIRWDVSGTAEA
ncbi:sterigmatocystin 8-O-methyltransferase [Daldinia decipiens]|uniref:sterigmatocystin 8-O-methyltransferase n=1 Tax=Daldinia decipiens TaxID=326647 RepID=UPI0020C326FB|nr:sterigmatocystin 8-O-methyltransferase [Daldinia decipiens]KAI1660016.1 sterigmatocystin 8-O-methyltransferase [Daldinia decipiens]